MKQSIPPPALPPQPISEEVLLEKYAKGEERDAGAVFARVARALASTEQEPALWEEKFRAALEAGLIPAGRIMSAAGAGIQATLINCFVQPVGDSVSETVDGKPGIYQALAESAETMRRGGGVGYDFSAIRPKGAQVRGTASRASGPVSYMRVFDRSCETVESAGARRGAQMGVLRCDHPDVLDFIHAKDKPGELSNFNISVGVTDALMRAVEADGPWELAHKAEPGEECKRQGAYRREDGLWVYATLRARGLWEQVMASTYDHAEPGVLFLDTANADNNLYYCETFASTNPCAEQFLPAYGCCCLGSIDLSRFVRSPFSAAAGFDFAGFAEVAAVAVRLLDNVLDLTFWPLAKQREEAMAKRRVGLGFTGLGDALAMLGLRYDTAEARAAAAKIAESLRDAAYRASVELAKEKGAFPLFDAEKYLASGFASRLPKAVQEDIRRFGLRNSHLLSIAPTGTISLAFADNASNGIEPPFSWAYTRRKRQADGTVKEFSVEDHAWRLWRERGGDTGQLPASFVTALEISALDHMRMLQAVQPFVDSSISKCLLRGTRLLTNQGFLRIEDMGLATRPDTFDRPLEGLQVLCPDGRWRAVLSHYCGGVRPTVSIRLVNGQIVTGSETHRVMTHEGWKPLADIEEQDYVIVRRGVAHQNTGALPLPPVGEIDRRCNGFTVPSHMSESLALFLGMMAADGHLQLENGHISLCQNDRGVGETYASLVEALFSMTPKHSIDPRNQVNAWIFNSKPLCAWIVGLIGYRSHDKHVPEAIMRGSSPEQMAFLSGTTLDGYKVVTASREYTVIYEGRSERLARELFSLCWANGMLPRIFDKPVDGYGYRVYGTRVAGFSEALEQHKNSLRSEADEYIVLPDSPENLKVNTSHQGYSCVRNWWTRDSVVCKESSMKKLGLEYDPDFIALRVSQVTHGQGEVFDVEVDESHDYLVDGVVSHNTVNVPAEYPFEDFQGLYREAWKAGLKGLATYRPNAIVGQVLVAEPAPAAAEQAFDETDPDRRLRLEHVPEPALASLRWRRRPRPPAGNPAWTYFVEHGLGSFAVFVGHWDAQEESQDWPGLSGSQPFEVWVNGAEQPRGLAALAKSLSMDMRSNDRGWLETKLKSLMKAHGDDGFMLAMPPDGEPVRVPSLVAGFAKLVHHRCQELGAFEAIGETPVLDALMSPKEPKTGTEGTLSWTVDIHNPATCDDFVMGLKELSLPNGQRRPYSVWLSGEYPKVLDGLCKSLSYDMRVVDPAWIGAKLRQLLDFPEPRGDFLAWVPGERRKVSYPSTVAYLCRLVLHRYAMLGILDEEGFPVDEMGVMVEYGPPPRPEEAAAALAARPGKPCPECGNHAVIRKDGCDFCTACGAIGACG